MCQLIIHGVSNVDTIGILQALNGRECPSWSCRVHWAGCKYRFSLGLCTDWGFGGCPHVKLVLRLEDTGDDHTTHGVEPVPTSFYSWSLAWQVTTIAPTANYRISVCGLWDEKNHCFCSWNSEHKQLHSPRLIRVDSFCCINAQLRVWEILRSWFERGT